MKKLISLLPILTPILIYISYLHVYFYYDYYNIDISQWISVEEILTMFIDDGSEFIKYGIIIGVFAYAALMIDLVKIEKKYSVYFIIGKYLVITVALGALIFLFIDFFPSTEFEKELNLILSTVIAIVVCGQLALRRSKETLLAFLSSTIGFVCFTLLIAFLTNSILEPGKKIERNSKLPLTKVELKNGMVEGDSVRYIGKSKEYYFFGNKVDGKVSGIVVPKENLKSIEIKGKILVLN